MELEDRVAAVIDKAIDDVNAQMPAQSRLKKDPATVLFGRDEGLDSLALVNLIVALEKYIETGFGRSVPLSDPEVVFADESPFANVRSLREYVARRLERN